MAFWHKKDYHLNDLMPLFKERLAEGHTVRFGPKGTSMMPMIRQNIDTVVIAPVTGKLKKYDVPLYQRKGGQYVLHRITKVTGDTYTCIGDNQYTYEPGVRHDQMIAVMIGFYRDQEYISVNRWSYRIYCCLWHRSRWLRPRVRAVKNKIRRLFKKT